MLMRHSAQAKRSAMTPSTMDTVPSTRGRVQGSLSNQAPKIAAKSTEVSRSAAMSATGATVIAHKAIEYEAIDAAAPPAAKRQRPRT